MSERVERKILDLLDRPTESPYGNPIPGLAELGVIGDPEQFSDGVRQLSQVAGPTAAEVTVRRIGEPAQGDPEVLAELEAAGLRPGRRVSVRRVPGAVLVSAVVSNSGRKDTSRSDDDRRGEARLADSVADHVFVAVVLG